MKIRKQKIKNIKPGIRYLDDMKKVLYDQKWTKTAPNLELYYMYRGLKKHEDLRYDITIIPPKMLGREFVKTKGNRNSNNFLELYKVLKGQAIFLMQKTKEKKVEDVFAIKAGEGDSIIEPIGYSLVSINPSDKTLKLGNWISDRNKNIYDIGKLKGACYFFTIDGWVKNKNYKNIPKLRFKKPLKRIPKNLDFLKEYLARAWRNGRRIAFRTL